MSMAIAYAMKKKGRHMSRGGMSGAKCYAHGTEMCEMCHGGKMMAEGGHADDAGHRYKDVKGVNREYEPGISGTGISEAGQRVRAAHSIRKHGGRESNATLYEDVAKDKHKDTLRELKSMKKPHLYAEGGEVDDTDMVGRIMSNRSDKNSFEDEEKATGYRPMPEDREETNEAAMREDDRMLGQHGEYEVGAEGMDEDNKPQHERMISHAVENQDDHEDMVGRIMKQRAQHYSEGGRVANDTPPIADFEDNQFDDLVKDDDLEEHYTGDNSGDEIGDEQEDEDRHDIVSRIMKSRRLKDRMPHPA